VIERDWVFELERYLQERFTELCDAIGQPVGSAGLRLNPPLGTEEAKYFLLGLESGLFRPDLEGYVQSELLPPPSNGKTRQEMCQIFRHNPPPPRLFREGVCQLSTASSLILERGWLKSQILMEPSIKEHRSMAHGVDILVKSATGELLVGVEVKRSGAELQKLMRDFRQCCKRGPHAEAQCGFPQNHPKYEFCALYKPAYFWAVAPYEDICFRMTYHNDTMDPEEMETLPPRSTIESN
jgi:hypothetical protein